MDLERETFVTCVGQRLTGSRRLFPDRQPFSIFALRLRNQPIKLILPFKTVIKIPMSIVSN